MRISDWSSDVCSSDLALERIGEFCKEVGADADDDREHHHFDAGADHVAEHALGKEAGAVPEREGHEDEAGEARQLELENADEHLHREVEEGAIGSANV